MATESPKSVEDMSPHELNTWLLEKGLDEEYCTLLTKDHKVDGKTFIAITETELKSELGIAIFGPKKTVLRLIEEAKEQDKEAPSMLCYSYDERQTEDGATSSHHDPEAAGVCAPFGTTVLWKESVLKVHFSSKDGSTSIPVGKAWCIDNEPITTSKILDLANEWSANGRKCVPKFMPASSKESSDIRVEFKTSGGSWSHIGSRARKPRKDPSMVLNLGVGENDYKKYLIRHEFGHALGLGHEHQSKKAPIGLLNKKAVIDWLVKKGKMTKKEAEEKYHVDYERPAPKQVAIATEYDEGSIMQYWIHPDWIDKSHDYAQKNPSILQNGINWPPRCTLSEIDQKAIVRLYRGMYRPSRSQVDSGDFLDEEPSGDSTVYSGVPSSAASMITSVPTNVPSVSAVSTTTSVPTHAPAGTLVTKKALARLQIILNPMLSSWDLFMKQIGVPSEVVSQITTANARTSPEWLSTCFSQALAWWVANQRNPGATYEVILAVLDPEGDEIGPLMNRALAREVKDFMIKQQALLHHPAASNGAPLSSQQTVKKGKHTVEYQKLLKSSDSLVPQLAAAKCAGTLANKLRAKELIPDSVYNAATSYGPGITEPSQIQAIIDAMLPKVERNSENYYIFLRILQDIDRDFAQLVEEGGSS